MLEKNVEPNTGISGVVDPYGRVLARSELFETTAMTEDVRLLTGLTLYGRMGDLLAYLCVVATVAAGLATWRSEVGLARARDNARPAAR